MGDHFLVRFEDGLSKEGLPTTLIKTDPPSINSLAGTTLVSSDEFPRPGTTPETLAKLRPAFVKDGSGTVTAGNASGLNDGAAAVVLASREEAVRLGVAGKVKARVVSWAQAGVDPSIMGMGPVPAVKSAVSCLPAIVIV